MGRGFRQDALEGNEAVTTAQFNKFVIDINVALVMLTLLEQLRESNTGDIEALKLFIAPHRLEDIARQLIRIFEAIRILQQFFLGTPTTQWR